MKRILSILALIIISFNGISQVIPSRLPNTYVNNYGNYLNEGQIKDLNDQIIRIRDSSSAEIVILLYDDFQKSDLETITLGVMRDWGVGKKNKNNGLVYLISPKQRIGRIEVGYGLEGSLPDVTCKSIMSTSRDFYKNGNYYDGIKNVLNQLEKIILRDSIENNTGVAPVSSSNEAWLVLLIVVVLSVLIIAIVLWYNNKSKRISRSENGLRLKKGYLDKCNLLIADYKNSKRKIENKINSALEVSQTLLGYKYSHHQDYDKARLEGKIVEISRITIEELGDMNLETISNVYYNLQGLISSYSSCASNIKITVDKIVQKRKDFDKMLKDVNHKYLQLKKKGITEGLRKKEYLRLCDIKERKENHYTALSALMFFYDSLLHKDNHPYTRVVSDPVKPKKEEKRDDISTIATVAAVVSSRNDDDDRSSSSSSSFDSPSIDTSSFDLGGGSGGGGGSNDSW